MKMISREVGRCLTEYKRPDFDQIVADSLWFYTCSQERNLDSWTLDEFLQSQIKELKEPKCGYGMRLYAVLSNRTVVKLMEVIDSSD